MIHGNQSSADLLQQYLQKILEQGQGVQFFLLVGPEGIGKSSHAQQIIKSFLGDYEYSDFLYLKDRSFEMGKQHTIPVEVKESNRKIELEDGSEKEQIGIRELNVRLQQSGFSDKKFVLIENIQRMSGSAMNAFLKTAEEPLKNRFIIATVPHQSMLLDTIISRAVVIRFEELSQEEMKKFATEHTIQNADPNLQNLLIAMAMGKPGTLLQIHQQLEKNPELLQAFVTAENVLLDKKSSLVVQQKILKQILDAGLLQSFIDGRINYLTNQKLFPEADKRLQRKKMQNANVNQENLLLYGIL